MAQHAQQPAYGQPPVKKKRTGRILAIVLFACLLLCGGVVGASVIASSGEDTAGPGAQNAADALPDVVTKTIVMEITGPKKADVTYQLNADQSQDGGAKLPWKKTLTSSELSTIAVLSAQNAGDGEIHCKITMDGKVVKKNTSKGQFSIVTCEANDL